MRRLVLVAVLVIVVAVGYRVQQEPETTGTGTLTLNQPWPTEGENVRSFEAERMDGHEFEMLQEGTYVLSFWSGLNQGSQSARPAFERLAREYEGSEVSFAAVYVGSVPEDDLKEAPYAVIKDETGRLTSLYNVKRVPRIFFIEDGTVKLSQNNFYDQDKQDLRQMLETTLRSRS